MMHFTEIVDTAFSLYRRHFRIFFWLTTFYFVFDILIVIGFHFIGNGKVFDLMEQITNSLLYTLMCGLMIILASEIYLSQQITLRQVIQRFLERIYPYLCCSIIYVVTLHLPQLLPESETVTSIGLTSISLILIILVVYIFSGPIIFYLIINWIFYGPVLMIENTTAMHAFSRSRYLIHGMWWRTFWKVFQLLIFMLVIYFIILLSFVILLQLLGFFQSETSFWEVIQKQLRLLITSEYTPTSVTDWITTIFSTAINAWITPIYAISITILYFNHRSQKENIM
ncbi:hypothetical protein C6497_11415 [Candidatus Poribacteria bacterium]|nr:MAG: hypothetical protein C6497_11415 [Candidatus Poribacteria bacterium]